MLYHHQDEWPEACSFVCFYCHHPITEKPFINWIGDSTIYLHPPCVLELCLRLLKDVHEFECRYTKEVVFEDWPPGPHN
jgi:hypothetical protein